MKRQPPEQPKIDNDLPAGEWLDEFDNWNSIQKDKPITKASRKLYDFVNACVSDPDFLQSPELLRLLMLVRDVLADEPAESWTMETDYLAPIESWIRSRAASQKNKELRERCQREWLEKQAKMPKIQKTVFAGSFRSQNNLKKPSRKTIAEVWLSDNEIEAFIKAQ